MAERGLDHVQARAPGDLIGQLLLQRQWVQPVGVQPCDTHGHRDGSEDFGLFRPTTADVVGAHGIAERHVGTRIEPVDQLVGVMVQVGLHREAPGIIVTPRGPSAVRVLPCLVIPAES